MKCNSPARRGFTLVELLVVIGIIALLISILLPSLNRARESAKRVKCLSNERSIGQSLLLYTNDNRGTYPTSYFRGGATAVDFGLPEVRIRWTWLDDTPPSADPGVNFLGSLLEANDGLQDALVCPSSNLLAGVNPAENQPITNFSPNAMFLGRRISAVPGSSEYALMQENKYSNISVFYRPTRFITVSPNNAGTPDKFLRPYKPGDRYNAWAATQAFIPNAENTLGNIHDNGGNFLFADGHADYRRFKDTTAKLFGLVGKPSLPGVTGNTDDGYVAGITGGYGSIFENPQ